MIFLSFTYVLLTLQIHRHHRAGSVSSGNVIYRTNVTKAKEKQLGTEVLESFCPGTYLSHSLYILRLLPDKQIEDRLRLLSTKSVHLSETVKQSEVQGNAKLTDR